MTTTSALGSVSTFRPAMRSAALSRLVADIADTPTADIADRYGEHARPLDLDWRSFGAWPRFFGPVRTVRCRDDDGLVHQLLDGPGTGAVLVVDGHGSTHGALLGDPGATVAAGQGWAGVIVSGAVRDVAQLATVGIGIAATATSPVRSASIGRGEVDVPLVLGGSPVRPGDVVVSDRDGVLVLDPLRAQGCRPG